MLKLLENMMNEKGHFIENHYVVSIKLVINKIEILHVVSGEL